VLPEPRHQLLSSEQQTRYERHFDELTTTKQKNKPPPYGARTGWKPRNADDYGDGGSFPEIHLAQYPLEMGRSKASKSGGALPLQVDAEGNIRYDDIARQGHNKSRVIHSQFKDLVPVNQRSDIEQINFERPGEEEVKETTEKTREALEKIVQGKIKASQPKNVKSDKPSEPTYIRYTPGQQGEAYNSGAKQRIIRMVEMPVDPMEPPKFKHKKIPRGPPSPPAPVLHSPPRKVSAKEQQEWVIPPCISNWKNAKGYTIPLDKRLAADGRGLQEVREREGIRQERRKEREREYRLSRMGAEQRAKYLAREQNRDISEKIALGLAKPTLSKESLYDSRLFNQSEGLSSGFKDDDVYDLYDKPLFAGSSSSSIYNPKKAYDSDQFGGGNEESINRMLSVDRFGIASKGFQGTDKNQTREGPVEFEKEEADPFGFSQFLDDAKKGSKRGLDM
ncbi:3309_t:CDS:2, partial [Acaulospora colombiana]